MFYRKPANWGIDQQNKRSQEGPKSLALTGSSLADRRRAKSAPYLDTVEFTAPVHLVASLGPRRWRVISAHAH